MVWLSALHSTTLGCENGSDRLLQPTHLDHHNRGIFLSVEKDFCTVRYKGMGNDSQDVGVIRSNAPFTGQEPVDYFEVEVLQCGDESSDICIGVSTSDMVTTRHVGHCSHSWGYSAGDGCKYHYGSRYGLAYASKYGAGDVIGCGIDWSRRDIFFTLNGKHLGTAFSSVTFKSNRIYPTVSLHSNGDRVRCNFRGPFRFQNRLDLMLDKRRHAMRAQIDSTEIHVGDVHALVEEYLLHEGYLETLQCFSETVNRRNPANGASDMKNAGTNDTKGTNPLIAISNKRKTLGQLVLDGHIEQVLQMLPELLPDVYHPSSAHIYSSMLLKLHCQCFVEHIRNGCVDEAVQYATEYIYPFSVGASTEQAMSDCDGEGNSNDSDDMSVDNGAESRSESDGSGQANYRRHLESIKLFAEDEELIYNTLGLLAYVDPNQSPLHSLMDVERRRSLWDEIQKLIIQRHDISPTSRMEVLLKHLVLLKMVCPAEGAQGIANAISDN